MESQEISLIEKYAKQDPILRNLYEEHKRLDKKLAKLAKKPFLTSAEEGEEQRLKKLKLLGKDKIMRALAKYKE